MKKGCIIFASLFFLFSCSDSSDKTADSKTADSEASATAPPAEAVDTAAVSGMTLIAKSDCLTCHKLHETLIGPAYAAVAAKYKGHTDIIDSLANKVIKGGSGVWGAVPMLPHPNISLEDARTMIHYVLSVK